MKIPSPSHLTKKGFKEEEVPLGGRPQMTGGDIYARHMSDYSKTPREQPDELFE